MNKKLKKVKKYYNKLLTKRTSSDNIFFAVNKYAPLAQLVEQLTLNQWVQSSSL